MVVGLVPPDEEERICKKLLGYYKRIYPGVKFSLGKEVLTHERIGALLYTYCGEETEATAAEKMRRINSAISEGYSTPLIILKAGAKEIILDGHRRARVAYSQGMSWPAMVIRPGKRVRFGIEEMVLGQIKDLYGK